MLSYIIGVESEIRKIDKRAMNKDKIDNFQGISISSLIIIISSSVLILEMVPMEESREDREYKWKKEHENEEEILEEESGVLMNCCDSRWFIHKTPSQTHKK